MLKRCRYCSHWFMGAEHEASVCSVKCWPECPSQEPRGCSLCGRDFIANKAAQAACFECIKGRQEVKRKVDPYLALNTAVIQVTAALTREEWEVGVVRGAYGQPHLLINRSGETRRVKVRSGYLGEDGFLEFEREAKGRSGAFDNVAVYIRNTENVVLLPVIDGMAHLPYDIEDWKRAVKPKKGSHSVQDTPSE